MDTKIGKDILPKPTWIKVRLPAGNDWKEVEETIERHSLHTVCDSAHCPNKGECWGCGTATFMVLGDICTRGCRFCAVSTALQGIPPAPDEPEELAAAIAELKLSYAVITSVDRDDLPDRGAGHFASCIAAVRQWNPGTKVEVLIPDYFDSELETVVAARPDVLAHNVETVRRLQNIRDQRASFDKSLRTLRQAAAFGKGSLITKSSIMLGLGETRDELKMAYDELVAAGVSILVMGQYLQPTQHEIPVVEYIHPDTFAIYAEEARKAGFATVISAPFARTSYHALSAWQARKNAGTSASPDGCAQ
ncbi:MAG: lipoyl synthase [Spirochaetaceae bacterium]|nr:lipoyl synthase [Spirochaetaceae bacterium]